MIKSDLVKILHNKFRSLSMQEANTIVNLIFDEFTRALEEERRIEIRGFGSMTARRRSKRIVRNPKTGETVELPARLVPYFRAGKVLMEKLNK